MVQVNAAIASSLEHLVIMPTDLVFNARVSRGKHVLKRQNLCLDPGRLARTRVDQHSNEQPLVNGLLYLHTQVRHPNIIAVEIALPLYIVLARARELYTYLGQYRQLGRLRGFSPLFFVLLLPPF